ncbi:MAG: hypothetical protein JNL98_13680 [Bryobacterales bacterium]|nr:hypothetical protein [Bryobacterales bacterium]
MAIVRDPQYVLAVEFLKALNEHVRQMRTASVDLRTKSCAEVVGAMVRLRTAGGYLNLLLAEATLRVMTETTYHILRQAKKPTQELEQIASVLFAPHMDRPSAERLIRRELIPNTVSESQFAELASDASPDAAISWAYRITAGKESPFTAYSLIRPTSALIKERSVVGLLRRLGYVSGVSRLPLFALYECFRKGLDIQRILSGDDAYFESALPDGVWLSKPISGTVRVDRFSLQGLAEFFGSAVFCGSPLCQVAIG